MVKNKKDLKKSELKKSSTEIIDKSNFFNKLIKGFKVIKDNKLLFLLSLIVSLVYLGFFLFIVNYYTLEISIHEETVLKYISEIPLDDPTSLSQGNDPFAVLNAIEAIKKALLLMFVYLFIATLIIEGAAWYVVRCMFIKDKKVEFLKTYTITSIAYMGLISTLAVIMYNISLLQTLNLFSNTIIMILLMAFSFTIFYFYHISIPLTVKYGFKEIFLKTLKNSVNPLIKFKNIYLNFLNFIVLLISGLISMFFAITIYLDAETPISINYKFLILSLILLFLAIPVQMLSISLIFSSIFLINKTIDYSLILLMMSIIMFFFSLAYSKILFTTQFE